MAKFALQISPRFADYSTAITVVKGKDRTNKDILLPKITKFLKWANTDFLSCEITDIKETPTPEASRRKSRVSGFILVTYDAGDGDIWTTEYFFSFDKLF